MPGGPCQYWTLEQAQQFKEFDVYYLGPEFENMTLEKVWYDQKCPRPGDGAAVQNTVTFWYAPRGQLVSLQNAKIAIRNRSSARWSATTGYTPGSSSPRLEPDGAVSFYREAKGNKLTLTSGSLWVEIIDYRNIPEQEKSEGLLRIADLLIRANP